MNFKSLGFNWNLAQTLKGGVIMDVTTAKKAALAKEAGAVACMSDPKMIKEIQKTVSIPVMAKVRIGHIAKAQILEAFGIDFIEKMIRGGNNK